MNKMSRSEAGHLGAIKTKNLWLARYEQNPKLCKFCLKKLSYNKRHNTFCNNSCSASLNNIGVCRHKPDRLPVSKVYSKALQSRLNKEQICTCCQTVVYSKKVIKYCSQKCKRNYEWNLRKSQIEKLGVENSIRIAKRFLLEVRGTQCEICKNVEWCGKPIPLVMDHIDGHHENNSLDNLRLVCGNCDMQLPTYKNKNKGNGRHSRKKRYQDGKSF